MTELVDSSIAQYAVIEARRTEGPSECFVIAYPDEESLRDLIAGPSVPARALLRKSSRFDVVI